MDRCPARHNVRRRRGGACERMLLEGRVTLVQSALGVWEVVNESPFEIEHIVGRIVGRTRRREELETNGGLDRLSQIWEVTTVLAGKASEDRHRGQGQRTPGLQARTKRSSIFNFAVTSIFSCQRARCHLYRVAVSFTSKPAW